MLAKHAPNQWKKEFSLFDQHEYAELAYFDSAATSLVPKKVACDIAHYIQYEHANSHRGFYQLSVNSTQIVEHTRSSVAAFINASNANDLIFTPNTTHAINLVAQGYVKPIVDSEHNIVISVAEHHANFLPWQQLCRQTGAELRVVSILNNGEIDLAELNQLIDHKTIIVAVAHVSNVTGCENPIREIVKLARKHSAKLLVDGAQAVAHYDVDVQSFGCDFYVFSGHKCYAGSGTGVLYATQNVQDAMTPMILGGGIVDKVTTDDFKFCQGPQRFEAGSRNVASLVGLQSAIGVIQQFGQSRIKAHMSALSHYLNARLKELTFVEPLCLMDNKSIVSFNLSQVHSHDVATCLDAKQIAVRAGHHCAQPLHQFLNAKSSVRVSLGIYNDFADIDRLVQSLESTYRLLRIS